MVVLSMIYFLYVFERVSYHTADFLAIENRGSGCTLHNKSPTTRLFGRSGLYLSRKNRKRGCGTGKSALLLARFHADFPAYDIDVTATETIEQIALQCYYKYVVVNFRHYAFVVLYAVAPAVLSHGNGLAEQ